MVFGLYIHFPYCLQQCSYCDFATDLYKNEAKNDHYVELLLKEIEIRSKDFAPKILTSIYFGGGTPSLLTSSQIKKIFLQLEKFGFKQSKNCEISIEVNPDTINEKKLEEYLNLGINRFSLGIQSFDDRLLNNVGRLHSAKDTIDNLELFAKYQLNFSGDILYSLPHQDLSSIQSDLIKLLEYQPKHISPYILTLPEKHPLQKGRLPEEKQVDALKWIYKTLKEYGYTQYEISNFALPGFECRHNKNAWLGEEYLGLGMSAHSYIASEKWGMRFSNHNTVTAYEKHLQTPLLKKEKKYIEILKKNEALSDFCHTSLRLKEGISFARLEKKFGKKSKEYCLNRLQQAHLSNYLIWDEQSVALTQQGILFSNLVFSELVFLEEELGELDSL